MNEWLKLVQISNANVKAEKKSTLKCNKAGYTAGLVTCDWTRGSVAESARETLKKKTNKCVTDQSTNALPTNQPTDIVTHRVACTRPKMNCGLNVIYSA